MDIAKGPYGIVGLGLIGGSLALGLRRCTGETIVAVETDAVRRTLAETRGLVDHVADRIDAEELGRCATIFVCTPLSTFERVMAQLAQVLPSSALVTDVLPLKAPVLATAQRLAPGLRFVGGHPMAGGTGGLDAARADRFVGAPVALCGGDSESRAKVAALWRRLGAVPTETTAAHHDAAIALSSHLPYLVGIGLAELLEKEDVSLVGRGYRRATAAVLLPPEVMVDAIAQNLAVPAAAERLAGAIVGLSALARRGDVPALERRAQRAKEKRQSIVKRPRG